MPNELVRHEWPRTTDGRQLSLTEVTTAAAQARFELFNVIEQYATKRLGGNPIRAYVLNGWIIERRGFNYEAKPIVGDQPRPPFGFPSLSEAFIWCERNAAEERQ